MDSANTEPSVFNFDKYYEPIFKLESYFWCGGFGDTKTTMKTLNGYVVVKPNVPAHNPDFEVAKEDESIVVGVVIEGDEDVKGATVLFKKYQFDEYHGDLVGKKENLIAIV